MKFNLTNFQQFHEHFLSRSGTKEKGIIGKQRVAVFIYPSIILVIGVLLNLCNLTGPQQFFFKIANSIHALCAILLFAGYYYHRLSLVTAISVLCVLTQIEISSETIYCAFQNRPYYIALIIGNMVLSAIVLLLSIMAYLRAIPYVVAALSMLGFGAGVYLTGSEVLLNFFLVFFLAFLALSFLGWKLTANTSELERENSNLKEEQQQVLDVLQVSKEQMQSYMTLAQNQEQKLPPEKTAKLLELLGGAAEQQIRKNVTYYLKQSAIEFEKLNERLPELTTSEIEICSLILKEKKLKELSQELGKSPSNITCQRTNIRSKLGLKKEENLHQFLIKRMEKQ
ncbi:MAG: hypothetical protein RR365_13110 [Bacteroides sp.]